MGPPTSDIGVLFDIDDTLVDFAGAARSALLEVAASFDLAARGAVGAPPGAVAAHRAGAAHRADGAGRPSRQEVGEQVLSCWEVVSEREYGRFLAGELSFDDMRLARMTELLREMDPSGVLGLDPAELELLRNESIFTHYRPYDDVPPALERFRSAGVTVGVVSNSDGDHQRRKMAAAGLDHLMAAAVFSGDLGVSKPDPAIFVAGAAALGLPVDHVVYVGDRWATDAVGALRAGLSAVWLNRLELPRPAGAADDLGSVPGSADRLAELTGLEPLDVEFARRLVTR